MIPGSVMSSYRCAEGCGARAEVTRFEFRKYGPGDTLRRQGWVFSLRRRGWVCAACTTEAAA